VIEEISSRQKKARNGGEKREIKLTALNRGDKNPVYFE
jgi:hypothetical protein